MVGAVWIQRAWLLFAADFKMEAKRGIVNSRAQIGRE